MKKFLKKRQRETAQLLVDAFSSLLQTTSFEKLTIQSICALSGVSRDSFYRLFYTKEALFDYTIAQQIFEGIYRFEEYILQERTHIDYDSALLAYTNYFYFWKEKQSFLSLINKQQKFILFQKIFIDTCVVCIEKHSKIDNNLKIYYANSIASTFSTILKIWTQRDFQESPAELAECTLTIFNYKSPQGDFII